MKDTLHKFLFADNSLRIEAVNLSQSWQDTIAHQHYPKVVQQLLGELCAASVLLAANIKFEGSLILQLQGQGAISLIVVECNNHLQLRATVKLRPEFAIRANDNLQTLLNADKRGRFSVILDLKNRQPGQQAYQGIVPLTGDSVASVLEEYMSSSEQLETRILLACDHAKASGILLQKLAQQGGHSQHQGDANDNWQRASHYLQTVSREEQLQLDELALLQRLFWEDDLRQTEAPKAIEWHCSCSHERVADMLKSLGVQEVESIIEEQGEVAINCEFCGQSYVFDPIEAAKLFIASDKLSPNNSQVSH
ncbi:Hsp33 family molecular chaperone HslO [Brackiella oedipodis]|uniref:Hsp33 family molecular chaperone HslO n=1 Tax=Brackiella oedipodis TaxID=124225 RepID=UPI00048F07FC|nr:Hsp33 family molecular chaperone HslO [Brackiella oedipodis]